jgi:integrase
MASIRERNGAYFIMVSGGYDSTGKQIRKTVTWKPEEGMTEKQIEKALNEQSVFFEKKVMAGEVLDGSVTFAKFTERWIRDYAEDQLAPKTYQRYQSMLSRVLPAIGHIRLDKLQPHHLMELYKDMSSDINHQSISFLPTEAFLSKFEESGWTKIFLSQTTGVHVNTIYNIFRDIPIAEQTAQKVCDMFGISFSEGFQLSRPSKGLSNKTIKHHHRLISAILNQAVYWQVIPSNAAQRVKPPKVARTEAKFLDEKQTSKLLLLLEKESMQHSSMIKLFVYSGLRRGEMCGLEWDDIDFCNNLITVRRSSQYVLSKGIFTKETKTETSDRTIKLPTQAFEILKEYRIWQTVERLKYGREWEDHNRLFTQEDGKPIHPDTITGWFRDFIAKTDLPKISIHSLRHTNITLLIAAGVPLRTVSYRAGHAQTSTTANIYSHAIRTADEMAAGALDDILTPVKVNVRNSKVINIG